jgi:hypothetical protein
LTHGANGLRDSSRRGGGLVAWWLAPTQAAITTGHDERAPIRPVAEGRR